MPRLDPVEEPYAPDVEASIRKWTLPDFDGVEPLLFRIFHVHPELAARCRVMGAGLLAHGKLGGWDRELIVDRITGRYGAIQEWGMHATFYSPPEGVTVEHATALAAGPTPEDGLWSDADLELLAAVDELCDTTDMSDETWGRLRERYDDDQLLEFIIIVGWYRMISSICNGLRLGPEEYHPPLPETTGARRPLA